MPVSLHADWTLLDGRLQSGIVVHVGRDGLIADVDTGVARTGMAIETLPPPSPTELQPSELGASLAENALYGPSGEFAPARGRRVHRLRNRVLLPGFVNAHSHAFQRLLRGRTEQRSPGRTDDFWAWRNAMFRASEQLRPEDLEAVSRLAFMEMLLAGFTHVVEFHYLHHQPGGTPYEDPAELSKRVLEAAESAGIGISLLRVAYQRGGHDKEPGPEQRRFVDPDLEAYRRGFEATKTHLQVSGWRPVQLGVAAHSVRALDDPYLKGLAELAAEEACPLHSHVAEQPREVEECLAERNKRPVEALEGLGFLNDRFTAVHATHLGSGEAELLGAAGASVCVCPTTERNLGDGLPNLGALRAVGVRVAVGSDSQVRIDPFAELRALEDGERLRSQSRVCLANSSTGQVAPSLFAAGSQGGAHSAGIRAGAIAPGLRADLVALDLGHPMLLGAFPVEGDPIHALANLVLSGSPHLVKDVWVGGRHTVDDGVLLRWDAAAEAYCKVTERVFG